MKATDVIKRDHKAIEAMFAKFEAASSEERAEMEPKFFNMLAAHELMEDRHFYPALDGKLEDSEALDELEAEQKKLHLEAGAIRMMVGVRDKALLAAMDTIVSHAKKEEELLFPQVEAALSEDELEDLGAVMAPHSAVEAADDSMIETVKNIAS